MKLKVSGYSRETRWEILKSGTRKYNRMLKEEKDGKRSLNRPRWEGGYGRYWGKIMQKTNWYKKRSRKGSEPGERKPGVGRRGEGGARRETEIVEKGENRRVSREEEGEAETVMFLSCTPEENS